MNPAGLTFVLSGVLSALKTPFFQQIVTNGSVKQDEFHGTIANLSAVEATLKKTPGPKIEAMVAQYNAELSAHLNKFNSEWTGHPLPAFRDAQQMAGFITTIMAKSGLTE
jgi:hypothetical protein